MRSWRTSSSAVLIALEDDTGVLDGGSGFAMISHGEYGVLPKVQAAPQVALCKLGPVKEQDEEQVLSGTAEGERVVKFEKVSKELSELEEEEQSKDREEEGAEIEKTRAAAEQQVLDNQAKQDRSRIGGVGGRLGLGAEIQWENGLVLGARYAFVYHRSRRLDEETVTVSSLLQGEAAVVLAFAF